MYTLEMDTLNQIFKSTRKNRTKNPTRNNVPLYKLSDGGKCPDQEYGDLKEIYWDHFGCNIYDFRGEKDEKGKNAFQCASERMAHMKKLLKNNRVVDGKHIYPIKLAYDMGKTCLQNTLLGDAYIKKFKNYYNEITKAYPQTIPLFQTDVDISNYPLEMNKKSIKNFINSKLKTNPFITVNKNNSKQASKQTPISNHNKTKKNNKTKTNILTHIP